MILKRPRNIAAAPAVAGRPRRRLAAAGTLLVAGVCALACGGEQRRPEGPAPEYEVRPLSPWPADSGDVTGTPAEVEAAKPPVAPEVAAATLAPPGRIPVSDAGTDMPAADAAAAD